MTQDILSDRDLDVIFREARSFSGWQEKAVSEVTLRAMYDLLRWGPTSYNCCPARFVIVQSVAAKEKLADCVMALNRNKMMLAPATVIVASDDKFYQNLPLLYKKHSGAKDIFVNDDTLAEETAFRNSSLQGGYMIIAARALGLDCCPMSGFDPKKINEAFFHDRSYRVNFICSIGYGDKADLSARDPRLSFDEACEII